LVGNMVDTQYITHVEAAPEGDAFYPNDAWKGWGAEELRTHDADDKHDHSYVIKRYERPSE
ncbi:MAG: dihydrofolate reductase, partial [Bacteroidota bacterium]|nr:dihydrofolate reductase [Bacteroidota bacterium]